MKIGIISLGCCKNLVDTQNIMSSLKASGHEFVSDPKKADVIVINTCGFINDAKQESINTILEMAEYKQQNLKYLIVTGCLVQRYLNDLKRELPEVDLFIPISDYKKIDEILNEFLHTKTIGEHETLLATPSYWAYLRISDGCDNRCAYCAIPLIRKEMKSVPFEQLIQKAKDLEKIGVKELNIIAQDTSRYGKDLYGRFRLHELLIELNKMDFKWIRILYLYPDEIYPELLQAMKECDKVLPYFDIPTQHASNKMLKLMNRRGLIENIKKDIQKIKDTFKNPTLRTTVIVGFPCEEEDDFKQLMQFTKETRWDRLGAFTYSLEEDTAAYDLAPRVDEKIAQERLEQLMAMQAQISLENNQKYIGQSIEVLVEGIDNITGKYKGRGKMHAPDDIDGHVLFRSTNFVQEGEIVNVVIEEVSEYDLFGKQA